MKTKKSEKGAETKTITIELSEHAAAALEVFEWKFRVDPKDLVRDLVEYCLADSFDQGVDSEIMQTFAEHALDNDPEHNWTAHRERALENLGQAKAYLARRKKSLAMKEAA